MDILARVKTDNIYIRAFETAVNEDGRKKVRSMLWDAFPDRYERAFSKFASGEDIQKLHEAEVASVYIANVGIQDEDPRLVTRFKKMVTEGRRFSGPGFTASEMVNRMKASTAISTSPPTDGSFSIQYN